MSTTDSTTVTAAADAVLANAAAKDKDPRYIAVTMTPELLTAIRTAAGDTPLGTWIKALIARELNVDITVNASPRQKYATEAERKEALKAQRKDRNSLIKELLAKHKAEMAAAAKAAQAQS